MLRRNLPTPILMGAQFGCLCRSHRDPSKTLWQTPDDVEPRQGADNGRALADGLPAHHDQVVGDKPRGQATQARSDGLNQSRANKGIVHKNFQCLDCCLFGLLCSASSIAGSISVNHCCMKWMRSTVSTANSKSFR